MFENTFGVEIECYLPIGGTSPQAAAAITARLGALGTCTVQHYNHQVCQQWKIVTDNSLGDYSRGIEIVSPILSGPAGLEALKAVMDALIDYGCTVSKLCGLHVHVGVGAAPTDFFKRLLKIYQANEPIIDRFMPPSRRDSANMYCRTLATLPVRAIDSATGLDGLIAIMPGTGTSKRYHKVNLLAYRRYQTVEFRQHAGTLEAAKATNWIKFCLRMVKAAQEGRTGPSVAPIAAAPATIQVAASIAQVNRGRHGSAARTIGDLMLRPQGVTKAEACAAVGWQSCSMPQQARSCGLSFTTQTIGREVRYFARPIAGTATVEAPAPAPAPVARPTLDTLFDTLECANDEREFFRTRTINLSGSVAWAA